VQRTASRRRQYRLGMRDLQARANPCNALFITRNEQVSGSSPLVGSLCFSLICRENAKIRLGLDVFDWTFDANLMPTHWVKRTFNSLTLIGMGLRPARRRLEVREALAKVLRLEAEERKRLAMTFAYGQGEKVNESYLSAKKEPTIKECLGTVADPLRARGSLPARCASTGCEEEVLPGGSPRSWLLSHSGNAERTPAILYICASNARGLPTTSLSGSLPINSPLRVTIVPCSSSDKASTAAVPILEPSMRSKAVGMPPLWAWPMTVRRDS